VGLVLDPGHCIARINLLPIDTFASRLVMAGVNLKAVRTLMGHRTITMTMRYAHLAPEHLAAAVASLAQVDGGQGREAWAAGGVADVRA
jgi:hypothetical protein